ncbi:hypothetical protein A3759_28595 [Thalassolituus sp. HI0120]|nr:hypothetical protein A3759_28595 [Thalassolituus sp. HI0120]
MRLLMIFFSLVCSNAIAEGDNVIRLQGISIQGNSEEPRDLHYSVATTSGYRAFVSANLQLPGSLDETH